MNKRTQSVVSTLTALFFILTQVVLPLPAWAVEGTGAQPLSVKTHSAFELAIPSELGMVQRLVSGNGPTLIHIQTAHGNYEAQKKIETLLHYLKDHYGIKTVFIEGAVSKLEPEVLRLFPDRMDLTTKILDDLTHKAIIKGVDLFLLDEKEAAAYGIEDDGAYRANLSSFKAVLTEQEKTGGFVRDMDLQIERLTSPFLNGDLRAFLKQEERFESKTFPFMEWLSYLKGEAKKRLSVDLDDPAYQLEWPILLRIFKLRGFESRLDAKKLAAETPQFLEAIQGVPKDTYEGVEKLLTSPIGQGQLADPGTGLLFESMVSALPKDFNYDAYPNVKIVIGHLILQSEVKGDLLMAEMNHLTELILDRLAENETERKILGLLKDHRLLSRLFSLELTPEDYEAILARRHPEAPQGPKDLRPSEIIQHFQELNASGRVRDVQFAHLEEIDSLFDKALEFYRGVKARDGAMLRNIEKRLEETGEKRAVVITGGFHAGPFQDHFSKEGFNYALVAPRISSLEGRSAYVNSILEKSTLEPPDLADPQKPWTTNFVATEVANSVVEMAGQAGIVTVKGPNVGFTSTTGSDGKVNTVVVQFNGGLFPGEEVTVTVPVQTGKRVTQATTVTWTPAANRTTVQVTPLTSAEPVEVSAARSEVRAIFKDLGGLRGKAWWRAMESQRRAMIARFFGPMGKMITVPADHNKPERHFKHPELTKDEAQLAIFTSMAPYVDSFLINPENMLGRRDLKTGTFIPLEKIHPEANFGPLELHPSLPRNKLYVVKWEHEKTPSGDPKKGEADKIGNRPRNQGETLPVTLSQIATIPQIIGIKFMVYIDSSQPNTLDPIVEEVKVQSIATHEAGLLFFPEDLPAKGVNGKSLEEAFIDLDEPSEQVRKRKAIRERVWWEAENPLVFAEALSRHEVDYDAYKFTPPGSQATYPEELAVTHPGQPERVMGESHFRANLRRLRKATEGRLLMQLSGGAKDTAEKASLAAEEGLPIVGFFPGRGVWGESFWRQKEISPDKKERTLAAIEEDLRFGGAKTRFMELGTVMYQKMEPFWKHLGVPHDQVPAVARSEARRPKRNKALGQLRIDMGDTAPELSDRWAVVSFVLTPENGGTRQFLETELPGVIERSVKGTEGSFEDFKPRELQTSLGEVGERTYFEWLLSGVSGTKGRKANFNVRKASFSRNPLEDILASGTILLVPKRVHPGRKAAPAVVEAHPEAVAAARSELRPETDEVLSLRTTTGARADVRGRVYTRDEKEKVEWAIARTIQETESQRTEQDRLDLRAATRHMEALRSSQSSGKDIAEAEKFTEDRRHGNQKRNINDEIFPRSEMRGKGLANQSVPLLLRELRSGQASDLKERVHEGLTPVQEALVRVGPSVEVVDGLIKLIKDSSLENFPRVLAVETFAKLVGRTLGHESELAGRFIEATKGLLDRERINAYQELRVAVTEALRGMKDRIDRIRVRPNELALIGVKDSTLDAISTHLDNLFELDKGNARFPNAAMEAIARSEVRENKKIEVIWDKNAGTEVLKQGTYTSQPISSRDELISELQNWVREGRIPETRFMTSVSGQTTPDVIFIASTALGNIVEQVLWNDTIDLSNTLNRIIATFAERSKVRTMPEVFQQAAHEVLNHIAGLTFEVKSVDQFTYKIRIYNPDQKKANQVAHSTSKNPDVWKNSRAQRLVVFFSEDREEREYLIGIVPIGEDQQVDGEDHENQKFITQTDRRQVKRVNAPSELAFQTRMALREFPIRESVTDPETKVTAAKILKIWREVAAPRSEVRMDIEKARAIAGEEWSKVPAELRAVLAAILTHDEVMFLKPEVTVPDQNHFTVTVRNPKNQKDEILFTVKWQPKKFDFTVTNKESGDKTNRHYFVARESYFPRFLLIEVKKGLSKLSEDDTWNQWLVWAAELSDKERSEVRLDIAKARAITGAKWNWVSKELRAVLATILTDEEVMALSPRVAVTNEEHFHVVVNNPSNEKEAISFEIFTGATDPKTYGSAIRHVDSITGRADELEGVPTIQAEDGVPDSASLLIRVKTQLERLHENKIWNRWIVSAAARSEARSKQKESPVSFKGYASNQWILQFEVTASKASLPQVAQAIAESSPVKTRRVKITKIKIAKKARNWVAPNQFPKVNLTQGTLVEVETALSEEEVDRQNAPFFKAAAESQTASLRAQAAANQTTQLTQALQLAAKHDREAESLARAKKSARSEVRTELTFDLLEALINDLSQKVNTPLQNFISSEHAASLRGDARFILDRVTKALTEVKKAAEALASFQNPRNWGHRDISVAQISLVITSLDAVRKILEQEKDAFLDVKAIDKEILYIILRLRNLSVVIRRSEARAKRKKPTAVFTEEDHERKNLRIAAAAAESQAAGASAQAAAIREGIQIPNVPLEDLPEAQAEKLRRQLNEAARLDGEAATFRAVARNLPTAARSEIRIKPAITWLDQLAKDLRERVQNPLRAFLTSQLKALPVEEALDRKQQVALSRFDAKDRKGEYFEKKDARREEIMKVGKARDKAHEVAQRLGFLKRKVKTRKNAPPAATDIKIREINSLIGPLRVIRGELMQVNNSSLGSEAINQAIDGIISQLENLPVARSEARIAEIKVASHLTRIEKHADGSSSAVDVFTLNPPINKPTSKIEKVTVAFGEGFEETAVVIFALASSFDADRYYEAGNLVGVSGRHYQVGADGTIDLTQQVLKELVSRQDIGVLRIERPGVEEVRGVPFQITVTITPRSEVRDQTVALAGRDELKTEAKPEVGRTAASRQATVSAGRALTEQVIELLREAVAKLTGPEQVQVGAILGNLQEGLIDVGGAKDQIEAILTVTPNPFSAASQQELQGIVAAIPNRAEEREAGAQVLPMPTEEPKVTPEALQLAGTARRILSDLLKSQGQVSMNAGRQPSGIAVFNQVFPVNEFAEARETLLRITASLESGAEEAVTKANQSAVKELEERLGKVIRKLDERGIRILNLETTVFPETRAETRTAAVTPEATLEETTSLTPPLPELTELTEPAEITPSPITSTPPNTTILEGVAEGVELPTTTEITDLPSPVALVDLANIVNGQIVIKDENVPLTLKVSQELTENVLRLRLLAFFANPAALEILRQALNVPNLGATSPREEVPSVVGSAFGGQAVQLIPERFIDAILQEKTQSLTADDLNGSLLGPSAVEELSKHPRDLFAFLKGAEYLGRKFNLTAPKLALAVSKEDFLAGVKRVLENQASGLNFEERFEDLPALIERIQADQLFDFADPQNPAALTNVVNNHPGIALIVSPAEQGRYAGLPNTLLMIVDAAKISKKDAGLVLSTIPFGLMPAGRYIGRPDVLAVKIKEYMVPQSELELVQSAIRFLSFQGYLAQLFSRLAGQTVVQIAA